MPHISRGAAVAGASGSKTGNVQVGVLLVTIFLPGSSYARPELARWLDAAFVLRHNRSRGMEAILICQGVHSS